MIYNILAGVGRQKSPPDLLCRRQTLNIHNEERLKRGWVVRSIGRSVSGAFCQPSEFTQKSTTCCKERTSDPVLSPSGTRHEICYAVHAEQNAIIQAAKLGTSVQDATIYVTHQPCSICTKMIINSGIKRVVFKEGYPDDFSIELFKEAGVEVHKFPDADKE